MRKRCLAMSKSRPGLKTIQETPVKTVKLFSPAKINLYLEVLSKRSDGYHNIHTLFERVNLGDTITLRKTAAGIRITTNDPALPTGKNNLAYKAAALLKSECGLKEGVMIQIKKRTPMQSGLGGGSSNAATVLMGLNQLWGLNLSKKRLISLGAQLGSDVAFFLLETSFAIGEGRGEVLKPIWIPRAKIWHCLVKPPFNSSTKEAYQALKPSFLTSKKANVTLCAHSIQRGDWQGLSSLLTNSLELTLNKKVTRIFKIKKLLLENGAKVSLMTGSGSAVFGVFSSKSEANKAARILSSRYKSWKIFVVSTY